MEPWYWAFEFGKVLIVYMALMFVWPSVVFRRYLSGKSITFRFSFCVTVQILLVNTVVLALGLCHILNRWTMTAVFYGVFLVSALWKVRVTEDKVKPVRQLLSGSRGPRLFLLQCWWKIKAQAVKLWKLFLQKFKGNITVLLLLGIVIIFGMIYFTYGAFVDHSYGFGDMYTHHAWIYGLIQGQIFSDGVYPEAMHCFIYSMHTLFGVRVYSCMLFVAGIHSSVFLLAAFCLLRELFRSRYTPVFVLAMFLVIDLVCIDEVFSMARLQWTLPQEFGLYTQFLCALYLLRYLRAERTPVKENGKKKLIVWDENLFLFMMSLAASFAIHFYVTIMAFFLCLSFVVFCFHRIFIRGNFRSLAAVVCGGILISAVPMGLALASGIPFQGSINWAMNVISGTDTKEGRTQQAADTIGAEEGGQKEDISGKPEGGQKEPSGTESSEETLDGVPSGGEAVAVSNGIVERIRKKVEGLYQYGYVTLYRETRAGWILAATALAAGISVACFVAALIRRKKIRLEGYFGLTFASVLFMILYAAPFLRLPELIAGSRLCSTEQLLILAVMAIPVDVLFALLEKTVLVKVLHLAAVFGVGGIYVAVNCLGCYHGYLYYELTRYNSVVMVTENITRQFPDNSYTLVTTTDELYQVIQYGRHEESLVFLQKIYGVNYTIPTPYIFLYVEKKPIQYAQSHFFDGPEWLAQKKYTQYYTDYFSEGDEINASRISEQEAAKELIIYARPSQSYSILENRTIIESKMYQWCQDFGLRFPNEMNIYYEDDDFVCYMIRQNPYRLFHLEVP